MAERALAEHNAGRSTVLWFITLRLIAFGLFASVFIIELLPSNPLTECFGFGSALMPNMTAL